MNVMYDHIEWRRLLINLRCENLENRRAEAAKILDCVYNIITDISLSLNSRYGLADVEPPPSLETYLGLRSPSQRTCIQELLGLLQNQCRWQLGLFLDKIRHPLRRLELQFKVINLDAFKVPLKDENTPLNLMRHGVLDRVMYDLDRHLADLHRYRQDFKTEIVNIGAIIAQDRRRFSQEHEAAKEKGMVSKTQEELVTNIENYMNGLVGGKDMHDLKTTCQRLDLLKWGTWPILGEPVFKTLLMLDACIGLAQIPSFQEECAELKFQVIEGRVVWANGAK